MGFKIYRKRLNNRQPFFHACISYINRVHVCKKGAPLLTVIVQFDLIHFITIRFNFNSIAVDAFSDLLNLEILELKSSKLAKLEAKIFQNLNKLKILIINNNKLDQIDPDSFYNLNKLEKLDLSNNHIGMLESKTFQYLNSRSNLKSR